MFGFIKNLITGVLNFFIGLFGGKKSGYYMELDEAVEATKEVAKQASSKAKEAAESVTSKAKEAAESVTSSTKKAAEPAVANVKKAAEPAVANVKKAAEPAVANAKKAAEPVKAAAAKNGKNGKKDAAPTVEPEPAKVELVQTANGVKAQPATTSKADAKKAIQQPPDDPTFAPKYLAVPSTNNGGRRRPGANMSSFLDMAREVKTPG